VTQTIRTVPEPVTRLIDELSRLPGIGPKTASRLTFFLLRASNEQATALADALRDLKDRMRFCDVCFNITEASPCAVCESEDRARGLICVVEEPLDVLAVERTRQFHGLYHVLHGAISPMEGIHPDDLKIRELIARVAAGGVEEVILATNPSLEGENTAAFIRKKLSSYPVRVTRLAHGLPVGGDLEYTDEITLIRALEGRREI
jgi:recombination protein RecR